MSSPTTSTTVKFNVGGKMYEVSRSLLSQHPDTMLARMVSDTWVKDFDVGSKTTNEGEAEEAMGRQNEESAGEDDAKDLEPFFIERDGLRFRFILDYMRDGKVDLPAGCVISKKSLMEEFKYFGLENVPYDSVRFDYSNTPKAIDHLKKIEKEYLDRKKDLQLEKEDLQLEADLLEVAYYCYCEYRDNQEMKLVKYQYQFQSTPEAWSMFKKATAAPVGQFNSHMSLFGFECISISANHHPITIEWKKLCPTSNETA